MKKSDSIANLAKALVAVQGDLKNVSFDSRNPHFGNKYASLATIRDTLTPILAKAKLAVTQLLGTGQHGPVVETVLIHESGEFVSESFEIPASKNDPQGYCAAVTYGRRYGFQSITNTVGDEDDDGNAATAAQRERPARVEQPKAEPPKSTFGDKASEDAMTEGLKPPPPPKCSKCGGDMWDNVKERKEAIADKEAGRRSKAPPPAYKCKDKRCGNVEWEYPGEPKKGKPGPKALDRPTGNAPPWVEPMEIRTAGCQIEGNGDTNFDKLYHEIMAQGGEWRDWCMFNLVCTAITLCADKADLSTLGAVIADTFKMDGVCTEDQRSHVRLKYKERDQQLTK